MVSNLKYLVHVLFTIEMLVFILQLKKFLKNFAKTMQDTETQISQFIIEGTANSNMVSNCQYNIWFMFYSQLKC